MSNDLITFHFKDISLNAVEIDGDPWFLLRDVCKPLGISNSRDAASRLDDDEKGVVNTDTLGGIQETIVVSESGLYRLLMTSRKAEAKPFQKWVTAEVIPSIRKTGKYAFDQAQGPSEREQKLMTELLNLQRRHLKAMHELEDFHSQIETTAVAERMINQGMDDEAIAQAVGRLPSYVAHLRELVEAGVSPL